MDWLISNWTDILFAITGAVTVASVIVKLTPTPADDAVFAKVLKLLELLALNKK